jgi:hypothetical protein
MALLNNPATHFRHYACLDGTCVLVLWSQVLAFWTDVSVDILLGVRRTKIWACHDHVKSTVISIMPAAARADKDTGYHVQTFFCCLGSSSDTVLCDF